MYCQYSHIIGILSILVIADTIAPVLECRVGNSSYNIANARTCTFTEDDSTLSCSVADECTVVHYEAQLS